MTPLPDPDPLRRTVLTQWVWLGAVLALLALIAVLYLRSSYLHTLSTESTRLRGEASRSVDAMRARLQSIDASIGVLASRVQRLAPDLSGRNSLNRMLELAATLVGDSAVLIRFGRDGSVEASSRSSLVDSGARPFAIFETFRASTYRGPVRSDSSLNELLGMDGLAMGKPLFDASGAFDGVLVVLLDARSLMSPLSRAAYASDVRALLIDARGELLFWMPAYRDQSGPELSTGPLGLLGRFRNSGMDELVARGEDLAQTAERLAVLRRIETGAAVAEGGLVLILSRDVDAMFSDWRSEAMLVCAAGALLALGAVAALMRFQRQRGQEFHKNEQRALEREASFARLAESEERFRTLFLRLPVAYFALDEDGIWIDANRQTMRLLGIDSLGELLGRPFVDDWEQEFSTRYRGSFGNFRQEAGDICEMTLLRSDGEKVSVVAALNEDRDPVGGLRRIHGVFYDVTERRAMEQRVIKMNAELEAKVRARTAALTQANDLLRELARRDALTGLANRLAGNEMLQGEFAALKSGGPAYAVLLLDVDHFKRINDSFGHAVGDEVLKQVARVLQGQLRRSDFLARFGGEEFLAVLGTTDHDAAVLVAEKLRRAVEVAEHPVAGHFTLSIGLSMASVRDEDERAAVQRADVRLYQAKESGRNRVVAPVEQ